jgi:carbonic anhydrase
MKRILAAAAMMAVLVAPAVSQMNQGKQKTPLDLQYEKEAQDQQANERAYNEQMKRLKSQAPAAKIDPWAGVRPAGDTNAKR